MVGIADVHTARWRLAPHVRPTPVLTNPRLDASVGARLFFKCENLQPGGAFKIRGALNAVLSLTEAEALQGVATHSSGNHGAALALAAAARGVPAYIVMPHNARRVKREAVLAAGAEIVDCEPTLAAREAALQGVVERTGAHFVPPYDDDRVIAGQGTAALELLAQVPDLDQIWVPIGGGGLAAGTVVAAAGTAPHVTVVGAEPAGADDAYRSLEAGRLLPQTDPHTVADGLRTSLGRRNFEILSTHHVAVVRTSEAAIEQATADLLTTLRVIVEPSGAVPFAAITESPGLVAGRRVGLILSGGNLGREDLVDLLR